MNLNLYFTESFHGFLFVFETKGLFSLSPAMILIFIDFFCYHMNWSFMRVDMASLSSFASLMFKRGLQFLCWRVCNLLLGPLCFPFLNCLCGTLGIGPAFPFGVSHALPLVLTMSFSLMLTRGHPFMGMVCNLLRMVHGLNLGWHIAKTLA